MGYVSSVEQDEKKIYTITDSGIKFYEENKSQRIGYEMPPFSGWDYINGFELYDTMHILRYMGKMLAQSARTLSSEKLKKINMIVDRTYQELREIIRQPDLINNQ